MSKMKNTLYQTFSQSNSLSNDTKIVFWSISYREIWIFQFSIIENLHIFLKMLFLDVENILQHDLGVIFVQNFMRNLAMMFILCFYKVEKKLYVKSLWNSEKCNYNEKYPESGSSPKSASITEFSIAENGNAQIFSSKYLRDLEKLNFLDFHSKNRFLKIWI